MKKIHLIFFPKKLYFYLNFTQILVQISLCWWGWNCFLTQVNIWASRQSKEGGSLALFLFIDSTWQIWSLGINIARFLSVFFIFEPKLTNLEVIFEKNSLYCYIQERKGKGCPVNPFKNSVIWVVSRKKNIHFLLYLSDWSARRRKSVYQMKKGKTFRLIFPLSSVFQDS